MSNRRATLCDMLKAPPTMLVLANEIYRTQSSLEHKSYVHKKRRRNTTYTFNLHKPSKALERAVVGVVVMIVVSNHKKIMTAALMK